MSLFKTVALVKVSYGDSGYIKGKWVEGEITEEEFKGTWQPARGSVLETLPEGKRNEETYICYAPLELSFSVADPNGEKQGDCIKWEDKLYEVVTVAKWNNKIIPHWELICVRKKEGEK